jgi:hypothetical protein
MSNIINIINFITRSGLYVMFGLLSSYIVLENNYDVKMKDIDAIVQDITNKYDNLVEKMKNLETRVAKLEDDLETEKNINKIKLAEDVEELEEIKELEELEQEKEKELIQMMNEDIKIITDEIIEMTINEIVNENTVVNENALESKSLDDEIIDLSEEIYPVSNQNNKNQDKKGWIKTLLFM